MKYLECNMPELLQIQSEFQNCMGRNSTQKDLDEALKIFRIFFRLTESIHVSNGTELEFRLVTLIYHFVSLFQWKSKQKMESRCEDEDLRIKLLKENIPFYPDFPKQGVMFQDIFGAMRKAPVLKVLMELIQAHCYFRIF